ncbi:variant erythrocyte surface antigen-1 family protein [Babesia caballi]|uniref:Variant erythrocyte surface antigen-1 family protein n=1 Tax=Babesia caballi TaxID=5871 RepID=A0AAV4LU83_BABCB|nr:variant erythrocyte surface antigen-1 family protein [Babesia caballi]
MVGVSITLVTLPQPSESLGKAVEEVNSLSGNGRVNGGELNKLRDGLQKAVKWVEKDVKPGIRHYIGPIGRLATGLAEFVGYKNLNSSFYSGTDDWKITGSGIAPSNIATHRLCDATIAFTIGVLESLSKDRSIKNDMGNKQKGPGGFARVSEEVDKLEQVKGRGSNQKHFDAIIGKVKDNFKGQLKSVDSGGSNIGNKVGQYLDNVFKAVSCTANVTSQLQQLVTETKQTYDAKKLDSHISQVKNQLIPPGSQGFAKNILDAGTNAFRARLEYKTKYISLYAKNTNKDADWSRVDGNPTELQKCAKIFLGCLPLYYQALTYIYWGCHDKGGGWRNLTLGGGALRSYFDSQGLLPLYVDKSKRGAHIADSALKGFQEFGTAATSSFKDSNSSYVSFNEKLLGIVKREGSQNIHNTCPLSALYHGASCYFRYRQITNAKEASKSPKTIREMLCFLGALQFSPQYDAFDGYVAEYFKGILPNSQKNKDAELKLQVADSNIPSKRSSGGDDTLSAADIKEYLTASCAFSSSVLGLIQGPGASEKDSEPWLFELFCNSAFQFKYPSGAALLSKVSRYAYALQFQLLFLYQQCSNNGVKCGWQDCTYGRGINASGKSLQSHICLGFKCNGGSCDHKKGGTQCNHNKYDDTNGCGQSGSPSPLQAFITGALPSFGLSSSSTTNHMSDHPQGALCHNPMGFQANHLRSIGNGAAVYSVLKPICGNFSSPFRQLCEKLGCLTKRTPRSLRDIFGFTWHLNG